MILLLTESERVTNCRQTLEKATRERVQLVRDQKQALAVLSKQECSLLVVDQLHLDRNPGALDTLWKRAGSAAPMVVNFAVSSEKRLIVEMRWALQRREREKAQAARAARAAVHGEVSSALTGILLSSEMALAHPALPSALLSKLQSVNQLARELQQRLNPA